MAVITHNEDVKSFEPIKDTKNCKFSLVVSRYTDPVAEKEDIMSALSMLDAAFPQAFRSDQARTNWFKVATMRIIANRLTKQRLQDAVNNMIDHSRTFAQINIADIIDYDKVDTTELMTYSEMVRMVMSHQADSTDSFNVHIVNNQRFYEYGK